MYVNCSTYFMLARGARTMSSRLTTLERVMEKIGRERRSESAWVEIVSRQAEDGLSVQTFCKREGIKAVSLYGWRSRLQHETQGRSLAACALGSGGKRSARKSSSIWVHSARAGPGLRCGRI